MIANDLANQPRQRVEVYNYPKSPSSLQLRVTKPNPFMNDSIFITDRSSKEAITWCYKNTLGKHICFAESTVPGLDEAVNEKWRKKQNWIDVIVNTAPKWLKYQYEWLAYLNSMNLHKWRVFSG